MARATKTTTIRFFELVLTPSLERPGARDWVAVLNALRDRRMRALNHGQSELDGHVFGPDAAPGLSLTVDRAMAARQRNLASNSRKSMRTDGGQWQPAEESFAVFFDHNVFGLLRTSTAAPSHVAVAKWMTNCSPPQDRHNPGSQWLAQPVVNETIWEELRRDGREFNSIDFVLRPEEAPAMGSSMVGSFARSIAGPYDEGVEIEVKIRAGRRRGADHNRDRNAYEAQELFEASAANPDFIKSARAFVRPPGGGKQEEIDLIHQRIAQSVEIPIPRTDEDGEDLATIAAAEIRRAYNDLRSEIQRLVGHGG